MLSRGMMMYGIVTQHNTHSPLHLGFVGHVAMLCRVVCQESNSADDS